MKLIVKGKNRGFLVCCVDATVLVGGDCTSVLLLMTMRPRTLNVDWALVPCWRAVKTAVWCWRRRRFLGGFFGRWCSVESVRTAVLLKCCFVRWMLYDNRLERWTLTDIVVDWDVEVWMMLPPFTGLFVINLLKICSALPKIIPIIPYKVSINGD